MLTPEQIKAIEKEARNFSLKPPFQLGAMSTRFHEYQFCYIAGATAQAEKDKNDAIEFAQFVCDKIANNWCYSVGGLNDLYDRWKKQALSKINEH